MSCNIKNLNKIASFMLVSLTLSTPALARSFNTINENHIADASLGAFTVKPGYTEVIAKYAAPQFPIGEIKPGIDAPIISMYAAPEIPIRPIPVIPSISMYAAPEMPIREVKPDAVSPTIENDINNSIQKINKDSNMHNANIDNLINSAKTNSAKNNGQISNFSNNTTMNTPNSAKAAKILYEKDGSIRILGPISYSHTEKEK